MLWYGILNCSSTQLKVFVFRREQSFLTLIALVSLGSVLLLPWPNKIGGKNRPNSFQIVGQFEKKNLYCLQSAAAATWTKRLKPCHFNSHLRFVFRERLWCNRANYVARLQLPWMQISVFGPCSFQSNNDCFRRGKSLSAIWIIMALKRQTTRRSFFVFPIPIKFQAPPKVSRKVFVFNWKTITFF